MPNNPQRTTLDAILAETRGRVASLLESAADLERKARAAPPVRAFPAPTGEVGLIAEVKRRSPSQGAIRTDLDPAAHARGYVRGGAVAVSVLTEVKHFGGALEDLEQVAAAVRVPVLRKDFILDELQIIEARGAGASAVLLIVRALGAKRLRELAHAARQWGLQTLIEVHEAGELDVALSAQPGALGVNARDLTTFTVDLRQAETVIRTVPRGVPVVAESGIEGREDVQRLADAGADFVLVGTSVARQSDSELAVRALVGVKRNPR